MYAYRLSDGWHKEIIEPSVFSGAYSSIKIDSADNPHVALERDGAIAYANKTNGAWNMTVVDVMGTGNAGMGMDLDSRDLPHIAYSNRSDWSLVYTHFNGTDWTYENVSSESMGLSLALDSGDNPHISYFDRTNLQLIHAYSEGGSWIYQVVDPNTNMSDRGTWIALDSLDWAHFAYIDHDTRYLMYAYPIAIDAWQIERVAIAAYPGCGGYGHFQMDLDALDRPRIAYLNCTTVRRLDYAYKDGTWFTEVVDNNGSTGGSPSLTLDTDGNPHICYNYHMAGRVMYAGVPPPLPDLSISSSDIILDPNPAGNHQAVDVSATVRNIGTVSAVDIRVTSYDDTPSNVIDDSFILFLPVGDFAPIAFQWTPNTTGSHSICVLVDPDDLIRELDETNNLACVSIDVYATEAPGPPRLLDATLEGEGHKDVRISWLLSEDDGSGLDNVKGYEVLRGESYDGMGTGYSIVDVTSSGIGILVDIDAGEGAPSDYFYIVCAVNHFDNRSCSSNQAGKFTRPLVPGPNLVSVPLIQSNETIETVLQTVEYDKAWFYDSSSQEWKWHMTFKAYRRGLWTVNHTTGMWVNVTESSNLTVAGIVPAQTTIHLHEGWNLVSFPSFNSSYTVYDLKMDTGALRVEGYDPAPPHFLGVLGDAEVLQAGYGYWVRVDADVDWIVEVS